MTRAEQEQVQADVLAAAVLAKALWKTAPVKPSPEAFQVSVSSIMVHLRIVRRYPVKPTETE